jgi:hypothetical protein
MNKAHHSDMTRRDEMVATFELGAVGTSFATRGRGAELLARALGDAVGGRLVVDFTGVIHVSSSFADEFVGKLVTEHPGIEVTIIGLHGDVDRVVSSVLERRRTLEPAA